ncbi:hypothetical protein ACFQPF_04420 [Fictibacillus iocasae]|uniref:RsgI N-terminal anti-sigma domain-containing protein n=1 Tax=Fictibacillus iocasae TaxID=2715437 RepID=A0ABW2NKG0_9BACL
MKTGIVMEISKGKAVLLTKEGTFVTYRIPKGKNPKLGHEYAFDFFRDPYRYQFLFPSFSISLAAVLTFILYHGSMPLSRAETVAAYISFDVNPSLEAAVDQDLRILSVTALNTDAEEAVKRIGDVKGYTLSQFAEELMMDFEREGYLAPNRELMITAAKTKDASSAANEKIERSVKAIAEKTKERHHLAVSFASAPIKTRNEAKKKGITAGKFTLYLHAKKKNHKITVRQAEKMTVTQLKTEAARVKKREVVRAEEVEIPVSVKKETPKRTNAIKFQTSTEKQKVREFKQHAERFPLQNKQNKQKKDKNLQKKSVVKIKVRGPVQTSTIKRSEKNHVHKGKGKEKRKEKSVR